MDRLLFGAVWLLFGALVQTADRPDYKVLEHNENYEKRSYNATLWISTKVDDTSTGKLMEANSRLKEYCNKQQKAGYDQCDNTWPVLISVTDGTDITLSWFALTGSLHSDITVPDVTVEGKPETIVYVKTFGGTPSMEWGKENAEILQRDLERAGVTFDHHFYIGAGYDSFWALTHHNEIWMFST